MTPRRVFLLLVLPSLLLFAAPSNGTTFRVDVQHSSTDATPGNGICADREGECSLRAAVEEATAKEGADEIVLPVGIFFVGAPLVIEDELEIRGTGAATTIVDGSGRTVPFRVDRDGTLDLRDVWVRNGIYGAVSVHGEATLTRVRLAGNIGRDGGGLDVSSFASVRVFQSAITDNSTLPDTTQLGGNGGGIANFGTLGVYDSLIARNTTALGLFGGEGGGIYNELDGHLTLINSTVSSNVSERGSALSNRGTADIVQSTLAGNIGPAVDSRLGGSDVRFTRSLLANNVGDNCTGASFISSNDNLSDDETCDLTASRDQVGVDPQIGPLVFDQPTATGRVAGVHVPASGSPAIDPIPLSACTGLPEGDQLGAPRPADGDYDGTARCDIGAFERQPDPSTVDLADGRFRVEISWRDFEGGTGPGRLVTSTADSADFWFFSDDNVEMTLKVLDGCAFNDHFWVFFAASTNVAYTVHVEDLETGREKSYQNALGSFSPAVGDTSAFLCD